MLKVIRNCSLEKCAHGSFMSPAHPCKYQCQHPAPAPVIRTAQDIREQYTAPYSNEDIEKMMIEYHQQYVKQEAKEPDYKELREKLKKLLESEGKEGLERWLAMDKARMKCLKYGKHK